MIHCLHEGPGYAAVGTLDKCYCVRIDSEVGCNGHIGRHIRYRQRVVRSSIITRPVHEVVVGVGCRIYLRTVAAVVHCLHEGPGYAAVGTLDKRYCMSIDSEVGGNVYIRRYVSIGTWIIRRGIRPVYEVVSGIRHRRYSITIGTVVNHLRGLARKASARSGCIV